MRTYSVRIVDTVLEQDDPYGCFTNVLVRGSSKQEARAKARQRFPQTIVRPGSRTLPRYAIGRVWQKS